MKKLFITLLSLFALSCVTAQTWTNRDNFNRWEHPVDTAAPSKWKAVANMNGTLAFLNSDEMMTDSAAANASYAFAGFDSAFAAGTRQGIIVNQPYPWQGTYIVFTQHFRFTSLDYNGTGYRIRWMVRGNYAETSDTLVVERQATSSSRTVIAEVTGFEITAGDTLWYAVESDNTTISVYKNSTLLTQVTDATYAPTTWYTFMSIRRYANANEIDDFLVGTTGGSPGNTPPTVVSFTNSSPTDVVTADSLLQITARGADSGPGAGLDSIIIYVADTAFKKVGQIAATDTTIATNWTRFLKGSLNTHVRVVDDSGA